MKKLLFTMAATLAAFGTMYSETSLAVFDYTAKYAPEYADINLSTANLSVKGLSSFDYSNGLFAISGGASGTMDDSSWSTLKSGIRIVDLGGTVGRVLCINGNGSGFNTLSGLDEANQTSFAKFYSLHWVTDISSLSASDIVRFKIEYCIVADKDYATSNNKKLNIQPFNGDGSAKGTQYVEDILEFKSEDDFSLNIWHEYVYDIEKSTLGSSAPCLTFKQTHGANSTKYTILVRNVSISKVDNKEYSDPTVTTNTYTTAPTANHTVVSINDLNSTTATLTNKVEVAGSEFTGDEYKDYYTEANVLSLPFTIIPDINETNKGEVTLTGTFDDKTVDFGTVTTAKSISGTISNVNYKEGNYTLTVNDVESVFANALTLSEPNFDLDDTPVHYTNNSPIYSAPVNAVIFDDKITNIDNKLKAYASFNVDVTNSDEFYAGVLSEKAVTLKDVTYGLEGYVPKDGKTNWSTIAIEKEAMPLHVAGIQSGSEITRTLNVVYPFLTNLTISLDGAEVQATEEVLGYKVFTKVADKYTATSEAISNAQTSVANIAVEGNGKVEYFNLQGVSVDADALTPGLYIRRAGGKASKVVVK